MSQITGVGNTGYIVKTTAAATRPSSEKSESGSKEIEAKLTSGISAGASAVSTVKTDNVEYQTILSKVNNGQQLTSAELAILKEKNPAAYAKAIRTDTARQEFASRMEKSPKHDQVIISSSQA